VHVYFTLGMSPVGVSLAGCVHSSVNKPGTNGRVSYESLTHCRLYCRDGEKSRSWINDNKCTAGWISDRISVYGAHSIRATIAKIHILFSGWLYFIGAPRGRKTNCRRINRRRCVSMTDDACVIVWSWLCLSHKARQNFRLIRFRCVWGEGEGERERRDILRWTESTFVAVVPCAPRDVFLSLGLREACEILRWVCLFVCPLA